MIPLNHLRILTEGSNNHLVVGISFLMPPGIPVGMGIVGFTDPEELPEIADYLHKQVMNLYENWDKIIGKSDIPKEFLEAFDDELGNL